MQGETSLALWQADEKAVWRDVAAGLPRHISCDFNHRWRRKAVSTPFFISLLELRLPASLDQEFP